MNQPPPPCRWLRWMDYVLIIAAVVCAWAMLRVIGAERERRIRNMVYTISTLPSHEIPALPAKGASHAAHAPPPVRSKAAR